MNVLFSLLLLIIALSKRIGINGSSMGDSTAILTAAQSGVFSAVVSDSAFTSLKD